MTNEVTKITLLAYAPDDRYAFVREGDRIIHLRPPFKEDYPASEANVEYAVTVHGFAALRRDFNSRTALLDFLSEESVRAFNQAAEREGDLRQLREELDRVIDLCGCGGESWREEDGTERPIRAYEAAAILRARLDERENELEGLRKRIAEREGIGRTGAGRVAVGGLDEILAKTRALSPRTFQELQQVVQHIEQLIAQSEVPDGTTAAESCGHGHPRDACPVWRGEGIWEADVANVTPRDLQDRRAGACPIPPWKPVEGGT